MKDSVNYYLKDFVDSFPNLKEYQFKKGFDSQKSFVLKAILVRLCPRCNHSLLPKQIKCRSCSTYLSPRVKARWNRYRLQKKSHFLENKVPSNNREVEAASLFDLGYELDYPSSQELYKELSSFFMKRILVISLMFLLSLLFFYSVSVFFS